MEIAGRTVLLTGATGGIGHAIARELGRRGAKLRLTGRRTDVLEPLAKELGAESVAVDLSDRAAVDKLIADSADVDILVANAGLSASGPLDDFEPEQIDRALDVNLRAPLVMSRALGMEMGKRGSGHIVLMSSLSGRAGAGGSALYSATKFGLRGLGHSMREDLRSSGVGVSVVCPGFISDAGMFADSNTKLPPGIGTKTPEEVAGAVVKAIEQNKAEIAVAPIPMKVASALAGVAPGPALAISRKQGAGIAESIAAGHRHKR